MFEPPKCRKCKRTISFLTTENGKLMPVDDVAYILPYARGAVYYRGNGEKVRGYRVTPGTQGAVRAYTPHWYSCPFADENRKPKPDRRREAIKEQVAREKELAAKREARREAKAAKAAEAIEAEKAQFSIFGGLV